MFVFIPIMAGVATMTDAKNSTLAEWSDLHEALDFKNWIEADAMKGIDTA